MQSDKKLTTKQVKSVPNPTGKGGFGDNPQNRSDGGWKKEDSITYQYNKLLRLTPSELVSFQPETVAQKIALGRVNAAFDSLRDVQEITDRIEGKAQQSVDLTSAGEKLNTALVEFVDGNDKNTSS